MTGSLSSMSISTAASSSAAPRPSISASRKAARFVHITSTSGLIGNVGQANYAAAKLGITALSKSIALDMQRYNVRSNCLSPWAWSRMTSSIPAQTPEQKVMVEKLKAMTPDKNAPLAVFLMSDAAKDVSGQVFGTRMNEIYLFSSAKPIRIVHHDGGWTPEEIAQIALPALRGGVHAARYLRDGLRLGPGVVALRVERLGLCPKPQEGRCPSTPQGNSFP